MEGQTDALQSGYELANAATISPIFAAPFFIDVLDSQFLQFGPKTVKIQTKLALTKTFAGLQLFGDAFHAKARRIGRIGRLTEGQTEKGPRSGFF